MKSQIMRLILISLLATVTTACAPIVPAQTPVQLQYTPTAFVTIDETHYQAVQFTVQYPDGWRVVKLNTDGTPDHVIFVAPDETILISVSHEPAVLADSARSVTREMTVTADDVTLYLYGEATPDVSGQLNQHLQDVRDSLVINTVN